MNMLEIIGHKRDKMELSQEEIRFFIEKYNKGEIPDYQASALLMAIYLNKMTPEETANLTMSMAHSGDMADLSAIHGIKVDKHSSGGVGDKTTLVVGPIVAACGLAVAKMSGRGLGFSGGTIDKLESIPGFRSEIDQQEFFRLVNEHKIAVIGQSKGIAPADKKIYALRDVTGTVGDISLIASSIMSKKLAGGSDGIVLDVKAGSGAFMKTPEAAVELAREMVSIGLHKGRKMVACVTNMNQPLGHAVGNSLEVIEAVESLQGRGPKDFMELCYILAAQMLLMGEKAESIEDARALAEKAVADGRAFAKLEELVSNQGGDSSYLRNTVKFSKAKLETLVLASEAGYVTAIQGEAVGLASLGLGAGRHEKTDVIDPAVGVIIVKKVGDYVQPGDALAKVCANDESRGAAAAELVFKAYSIGAAPKPEPMLLAIVDALGVHSFI